MFRVIFFFIVTVFSLNAMSSEKCFSYQKEEVLVKRISKEKVSVEIVGKKEFSMLYFCVKDKTGLSCTGDDDSGRFILEDSTLVLKGALMLGNPDKSYSITEKDKYKLRECAK